MSLAVGIDLGGTKVEAVMLDSDAGLTPRHRVRLKTEQELGLDHVVGQIEKVCRHLEDESGIALPEKIGLCHPGAMDPQSGLLKGCNIRFLNGYPLQQELERRLGRKFFLANDANCFALAEAVYGAARGYETVFGVILGTGVGGGFVVNGSVLQGRHGIAGEWGQLILDPHGPPSVFGVRGSIEAYISGPALEAYYAEQSGSRLSLREIAQRAELQVDAVAVATIERLLETFARAISNIVNVLDPHAIVIGGGVGNIRALYTEETRRRIEPHIFTESFDAALLSPVLGDSAGVFGAAALGGTGPRSEDVPREKKERSDSVAAIA